LHSFIDTFAQASVVFHKGLIRFHKRKQHIWVWVSLQIINYY